MPSDPDPTELNRRFWDEAVAIHLASEFYDVASFKAGRSTLLPVEVAEVGDVHGKTLLHLQCHFGLDTLSWARAGATVTGVDFSGEAIEAARALAAELGIDARFLRSNVYDLPGAFSERFEIVFTSYGVLCWLPDLNAWAQVVANHLRPGGTFYIIEGHPMALALADDASRDDLRLHCDYFGSEKPIIFDQDQGTYADPDAKLTNHRTAEFWHSLGETVTALIDAGLRIEFLHEFPYCAWPAVRSMTKGDDGYYRLPDNDARIPFLFSIKATKDARL
jgi:SAM-dependent methyltransferase